MDDLEASCPAVLGGATLYSCSQSVFFATADGRALGTSRAFCAMISSITGVTEQVVGKPSLIGLRCAAQRLHVAPQELAVVGDDPELEMATARDADALAIAVTTGIHPADHSMALPQERRPHLTIAEAASSCAHPAPVTPPTSSSVCTGASASGPPSADPYAGAEPGPAPR
ncbi:HAD hydrolase-like protein [Streptomyces mirabilis]|nr:HAD hydrolase-like protein [Streptomyces mirabilis]